MAGLLFACSLPVDVFRLFAKYLDAGGPISRDPSARPLELPRDIKPGPFSGDLVLACPLKFVDVVFPRQAATADRLLEIVDAPS